MSIELLQVSKYFGEQAAVNNISFKANRGEIVGFLGPNGAGKSTTMKMITGFIASSSGTIKVNGVLVDPDQLNTRRHIGYLPENNPLYTDMYVREYLHFVGSIYRLKNLKSRVEEMINAVGLQVESNKKIGALSKGYRQRVGLAQAIIHDPDVLILDEPTTGLDPNQIVEIRELIKQIGSQKTVLLSTHIMQEVEAICNRVIIINKGKIVANDQKENLSKEVEVQTLYIEFEEKINRNQLQNLEGILKVKSLDKGWLVEGDKSIDLRKAIALKAKKEGWLILTLRIETKSLETVFKELTNK